MKDSFLCFLFAACVLRCSSCVQILCFCIAFLILIVKKKVKYVILIGLILLRCCVDSGFSASNEVKGRVVKLYENSFQIETRQGKIQIVSDEKPILDSIVICTGEFQMESDSSHFFQTESMTIGWMMCDQVETLKEGWTLRSMIHRKIMSINDKKTSDFIMKILLRCSNESDFGIVSSIALSYFVHFIYRCFRFVLNEKNSSKLEICLIVLFSSLWNLEMTGFRLLYFKGCKACRISFYESLGIYCVVMVLYDPSSLFSSSLWFGILIRLVLKSCQNKRLGILWILILTQLCFYGKCDVTQLLLYPVIQFVSIMSLVFSIAGLFVVMPLDFWFSFLQGFEKVLPSFELHGTISLIGILVLIYLLSYFSARGQLLFMGFTAVLCSVNLFSKVLFINVGQGDAALIQLPFQGLNVLIDTGPPSSLIELKNTLYANSVYEIDLLIVTHNDTDHSGNLEVLQKAFSVKEVWENTQKKNSYDLLNMLQLNEYLDDESENDRSLILAFEMNGLNFLFSGDAGQMKEEAAVSLLDETIDVCKISHHGSDSSTSMKYLDKAECSLAIISSGVNNRYGHPHSEVLNRLQRNGSTVLNTQIHGDIQIIMTRFFNLVTTSSHEFGIIGWY